MKPALQIRFVFVDGLRGIAALLVVFYHLSAAVAEISTSWAPPAVLELFRLGFAGVDIFFVISGFVIAYSVRNADFSLRFLGWFALRRSIRLEPPYWLAIGLEIAAISFVGILLPEMIKPLPSFSDVATHVFYAQDFFGVPSINPAFWTLCYEVQFYLFFVTALVARTAISNVVPNTIFVLRFWRFLDAVLFGYSLAIFAGALPNPLAGLFINRWWQFRLGVQAWRSVRTKEIFVLLLAAGLALGVILLRPDNAVNLLVACGTTLLVTYAGLSGKMALWLKASALQFLGRVSYSLYLFHPLIGWRVIKLFGVVLPTPLTAGVAWLAFGSGIAASVFASWILYLLAEKPSLALVHRLRRSSTVSTSAMEQT